MVNQTNHVPVVYVTFNYRLNAFGYLGSDRMRFLNADNSTGNAGQWDQHAAMLWVKKNIAAFGGDPGHVTIMGESAGAGSVSDHLAMPASRGLFHGAIIESGAPMSWTSQPLEDAEKNLVAMANAVGCDPDSGAVVACLQAADMQQLLDASDRNASFSIKHLAHPPWTPVVDGVTFLDAPDRVAAAGNTTKVPIIVGSNSNEGTLFVTSVPRNVSALVYSGFLAKVFGFELAIKVGLHYFSTNYESPWWALAAVVGDYLVRCRVEACSLLCGCGAVGLWLTLWLWLWLLRLWSCGATWLRGYVAAWAVWSISELPPPLSHSHTLCNMDFSLHAPPGGWQKTSAATCSSPCTCTGFRTSRRT